MIPPFLNITRNCGNEEFRQRRLVPLDVHLKVHLTNRSYPYVNMVNNNINVYSVLALHLKSNLHLKDESCTQKITKNRI